MSLFQSLSESEMAVMKTIWAADTPVTAARLLEIFPEKGWKIQTISTFLTRLVDKGVLAVAKQGKFNFYTPAISEEEYHKREAEHMIDSMYHGSILDFLAAFYGGRKVRQEELAELRQWFDEAAGHDD